MNIHIVYIQTYFTLCLPQTTKKDPFEENEEKLQIQSSKGTLLTTMSILSLYIEICILSCLFSLLEVSHFVATSENGLEIFSENGRRRDGRLSTNTNYYYHHHHHHHHNYRHHRQNLFLEGGCNSECRVWPHNSCCFSARLATRGIGPSLP